MDLKLLSVDGGGTANIAAVLFLIGDMPVWVKS